MKSYWFINESGWKCCEILIDSWTDPSPYIKLVVEQL